MTEDAVHDANNVVLFERNADSLGQVRTTPKVGDIQDVLVGEGNLLPTAPTLGLEANAVSNDGADDFDHRQRLIRNDDIEEFVGMSVRLPSQGFFV